KIINYDLKKTASKEEAVVFINTFIKTNAIEDKDAILSISDNESILVKYLTLPVLPEAEILEAAKWQLKEEVAFDLENALIDWQVVREFTGEDNAKKNEIIFVVAKKEVIDKYLSIVQLCHLEPVRITCTPFNYVNFLKSILENPSNLAVLDIGHDYATLAVYTNNKLNFIRKLAFSSQGLTQSLTGVLISEKGKVDISPEEAEDIKNTFGIPVDETQLIKGVKAVQIISLIRPLLEALVRELKLSFDYFTANFDSPRPGVLYITGGGANLKNLDKYLNTALDIKVTYLPLPPNIETLTPGREKLEQDQNTLMNALGAAIGGPYGINLLPLEIRTRKTESFQKSSLRFAAIIMGSIFLFLFFIARLDIGVLRGKLKHANARLKAVEPIRGFKQKIDLRLDVMEKIQKGKGPVTGLLKVIGNLLPREIILDELKFDQASHNLIVRGGVSGNEEAASVTLTNFMQQLERTSFIGEVSMLSSKRTGTVQRFEISCDLIMPR
ncbi:MAG: pilus assembly protein PilM, partial [Candidatus Omnitrophota bacterium]|nr:pilus assembly protein PilM [Candidatus Omnitrophota bacterium]